MKIRYRSSGDGPVTLLMVHGLGSNRKAWAKISPLLEGHYRCIAIDLPGYGSSSKGDYPYNIPFFAQKVNQLAHHLGAKRMVLMGHSMGGQIAIAAHLLEPALFEQLILFAPAGFETFNTAAREWLRAFYQPALLKAMPVAQIKHNFEANFYRFPSDAAFMVADRLAMREDPEAYAHFCRMVPRCVMGMLDYPVFNKLGQISAPTLIIYGEEDQLIPNKVLNPGLTTALVAQRGAARIGKSELHLLPRCGHFVPWECAQESAALARSFLERIA